MNEPQSNSNILGRVLNSKHARQTSLLFGSQILVLLFGIALKTLQTRNLTIEEYGSYAFFGTITSFLLLFFRFGYFNSTKVLLAEETDSNKSKQLLGAGAFIALLVGFGFSLTLMVLSLFVDRMFDVQIGKELLLFSPLCFIFPFKTFISEAGIGSNKVHAVSLFDLLFATTFLGSLFMVINDSNLDVSVLILLNITSLFLAVVISLFVLRPRFTELKSNLSLIHKKNKEYGFKYYTGAIVNQSTYKLDELMISYFVNVSQLGFYNLANILCSPMSYLSSAMSNSYFKKMAELKKVPQQLFIANTVWLISCLFGIYFLSDWIVEFLFGEQYQEAAFYAVTLSAAHFFQGLYAPYSFLSAKSRGNEIRKVAISESIINVLGNSILIPLYGVIGAIIASILSRAFHFIALRYYYNQYISGKLT